MLKKKKGRKISLFKETVLGYGCFHSGRVEFLFLKVTLDSNAFILYLISDSWNLCSLSSCSGLSEDNKHFWITLLCLWVEVYFWTLASWMCLFLLVERGAWHHPGVRNGGAGQRPMASSCLGQVSGHPLRNTEALVLLCTPPAQAALAQGSLQRQPRLAGSRVRLRAEVTLEESLNKAPQSAAVANAHSYLTGLEWTLCCRDRNF